MPRKLLLADDSVTIQRVIELTFADEDIQVIAVGDGAQAIARIDAERPDVVLADIGMPERDGYEVAAHVKGSPELAHIPVLLLTGAFEPIDEARARASGCDGVLVKPFEPQMVINRVKDLLAGRRPASLWSTPPGPVGTPAPRPAAGPPATPDSGLAELPGAHTDRPPAGPGTPLESLDDYFDRLDAAFSGEGDAQPPGGPADMPIVTPQAQPAADLGADFGSWDIPMGRPAASEPTGEPAAARPSADRHPAPEVARATPPERTIAPAPAPRSVAPSAPAAMNEPPAPPALADAFAALLAAEQRVGSSVGGPPAGGDIPEAVIEEIVRRVLTRLTDDAVRATVLDVAERLVREEIEKIKNP